MVDVYLGLGSNINPHTHLCSAIADLQQLYGCVRSSPAYESEPVGFKGDNFVNLVVALNTNAGVGELQSELKSLEDRSGRVRSAPKFSARTLDIDILMYGDLTGEVDGVLLPREEILRNAFVLRPFSELVPDLIHPTAQCALAQLWKEFDKSAQKLWQTSLPNSKLS